MYTNHDGDPNASLTLHVNNIELHGKPGIQKPNQLATVAAEANTEPCDDLPF